MTDAEERHGEPSIRVIARWIARPEIVAEVRTVLAELSARSLEEPGCFRFDVWERASRPGCFLLIEDYRDRCARRAHTQSSHFVDCVLNRAVSLGVERDVDEYVPWRTGYGASRF